MSQIDRLGFTTRIFFRCHPVSCVLSNFNLVVYVWEYFCKIYQRRGSFQYDKISRIRNSSFYRIKKRPQLYVDFNRQHANPQFSAELHSQYSNFPRLLNVIHLSNKNSYSIHISIIKLWWICVEKYCFFYVTCF